MSYLVILPCFLWTEVLFTCAQVLEVTVWADPLLADRALDDFEPAVFTAAIVTRLIPWHCRPSRRTARIGSIGTEGWRGPSQHTPHKARPVWSTPTHYPSSSRSRRTLERQPRSVVCQGIGRTSSSFLLKVETSTVFANVDVTDHPISNVLDHSPVDLAVLIVKAWTRVSVVPQGTLVATVPNHHFDTPRNTP